MKYLGELRLFPVSLKVGKKNIAFDICTNLTKDELTKALTSWAYRTSTHNCKSLVNYICLKQFYYGKELICITDKEYNALAEEVGDKSIKELKHLST